VKLLAFSDLHRDLDQAGRLVERSSEADVVIAAGDFASVHEGLDQTIGALSAISVPTILVPGNNETEDALRAACEGWDAATVLHGQGTEIDGTQFFGLGAGGIPRRCCFEAAASKPSLDSPTTLPVGFGGATPVVTKRALERGDRVLFFTDGVTEEDRRIGVELGTTRLKDLIERTGIAEEPVQETVRLLSRALMLERGGVTSDDATLLLIEWRGGSADYLANIDKPSR